jgi:hypothetical protein
VINLEFIFANGVSRMVYDVHPRSQSNAIPLPDGAVGVVVWLGTAAAGEAAESLPAAPGPIAETK